MNIQQIQYIIAVSKLKNFGRAADKCFITQSTLSTMIARFENEIGIVIFDRKTKPITITKEGEEIIYQLKIISKEIDNLQEVANNLKGELDGKLNIGVIPTIAPYLLPFFLKDFVQKYPQVNFVISEKTTEKIVDKIIKRELDIGILSIPLNHKELIEIPLYNEPFLLYDKAEKNAKEASKISAIDFDRLWLLEEGHCMATQVESICGLRKKRKHHSNLDYRSGTINTLLKFVNKNNGITLLPYLATFDLSKKEQLHLKKIRMPIPARAIGLVVHKHFVKRKILEALQLEIQDKIIPILSKKNFVQGTRKPKLKMIPPI